MVILRSNYYSSLTIEQREFGIKSVIRNLIDKMRDKTGDRIMKAYKKKKDSNYRFNEDYENFEKTIPENKELARKLVEEANKNNISVLDRNKFSEFINSRYNKGRNYRLRKESYITKPDKDFVNHAKIVEDAIKNSSPEELKEYGFTPDIIESYKASASGNPIINLDRDVSKGYNILSHELGHELSKRSRIGKKISDLDHELEDKFGVLNRAKKRVISSLNEQNANYEGKKLLKRVGGTKNDLKIYNKSRAKALKVNNTAKTARLYRDLAEKIYPKQSKIKSLFD